ncbi:leucine-rich repeat domain-containing protein [Firmicutes bacterium OM08-11AC]|jgi:hypothetical protein|nr:leucine-rich repeat domain-containing protein [Firmicutes bacterium OM08-11AC]
MTKGTRKTNRRLKKTVRKTLGTLFLISAIVVAAIPTEGLRAEEDAVAQAAHSHVDTHTGEKYKVSIRRNAAEKQSDLLAGSGIPTMDTLIPELPADTTIYTTGTSNTDGSNYQFAYIQDGNDWSAIILGYNKNNTLPNNALTIPNTVDAYIQPTGNLGSGNGYVAANRLGKPLYYEATTTRTREVDDTSKPILDDLGQVVKDPVTDKILYEKKTETYLTGEMKPCYATDNTWKSMDPLTKFFYYEDGKTANTVWGAINEADNQPATYENYANALDTDHQWITNGKVRYIGNQYLDSTHNDDSNTYSWSIGGYITQDNASKGIFAQAGNIGTLIIGEDLIGIGNYAFYECTGLNSISFGNGIRVIGNYAFAGCGSLGDVSIPEVCSLGQIGDHAFYSCTNLTKFSLPINVKYVGDYAFAECKLLSDFVMCNFGNENDRSNLTELGWNVFENCETLSSLTFPMNYDEAVDISLVKGCKNLRNITVRSKKMTFTEQTNGDVYCFSCFKDMLSEEPVNGTFYFEGRNDSALHTLTREKCFAFSYIDYDSDASQYKKLDKYELTVQDPKVVGEEGRSTYVVNSNNELISSTIGTGVEQLDIPDPIGPYHIYRIGANRFANNCNLKMVSLPASVVSVGDNAFKGCHNLATVIFNNSSVEIGTDAFKTQDYTGAAHRINCPGKVEVDSDNSPKVKLTFVGEVSPSSTPYLYAMSEDGRYNNGSQVKTYVRYCSGWPTNLVVQYNEEKGASELIDFPAFSQLSDFTNKTDYPYLTDSQREAAKTALDKYTNSQNLTEDQQQFIDSALNVVIPEGIQAIKDGLFVAKEEADAASLKEDKTVTIYGLDAIEVNDFRSADGTKAAAHLKGINILGNTASIAANAFEGCEKLETVNITGNMSSIGDYVFKNCPALNDVTLSGTINSLGLIPFTGCDKLSNVSFLGNDYFSCDNSIIYGMSGGAKARIIECLEGRTSKYVKPSELAGVTSIAPRAFQGCDALREIDLTESEITTVPEYAFADTTEMRTIKLPTTCTTIEDYAFQKSGMERLEASQYLNLIGQHAFDELLKANPDPKDVVICSPENSYLYNYAQLKGFTVDTTPLVEYFTVNFRDWNEKLGSYALVPDAEQRVKGGEAATPPTPAGKSGEVFQYWDPDPSEITADVTITAMYSKEDPDANKLTVTFQDWDGTVIKEIKVSSGGSIADADLPNTSNLVRDGYIFIGWDRPLTNITESFTTMAQYKALSEDDIVVRYINSVTKEVFYQTTIKKGTVAPSIQTPTVSGYTFKEWLPDIATAITENTDFYAVYEASGSNNGGTASPGTSTSPGASTSPGGNNNNGTTAKMYTLTVKNGSGSGSYVAGSQPIIVANDPAKNQQFSSWSIDPANTKIASKVLSATVITMPEANVTVTANYTAKSGSGNKTNTSTGSGNSTNSNSNRRPSSTTTGTVSGGRTTVVIDKNGLSNTGVVSATVNGSSDNFVIKITESAAASEEVVKALMAEYGSDISAIKYFPMDISLYDSTGNTKITDTTGLSISITLPLPDSLITYAGNNKVAGVVNSKLDKLSPKFSTISGVSCVTFTAEHFSPYVIYVDTNNLTAGTIADSTPKTGDGIHPKWFLSMGLACISVVLFMKKDKKTLRKARA